MENEKKENLPVISTELTFSNYVSTVKKYPTLSQEEEYMLAKRVQEYHDLEAAQKLVTSHLKLVAKMAYKMKGYGVALMDLVAEGNIGLMHAVKKFNPELGHRLSTYAMWWIKASMQEFIIKSWSLVKIGTTAAQKKLFFNLNKAKKRIISLSSDKNKTDINDLDAIEVAKELNVTTAEVKEMNKRMSGADLSLDTMSVNNNSDDRESLSVIDILPEKSLNQETQYILDQEATYKKQLFREAYSNLNEREQAIVKARHLVEEPLRLEDLSQKYNISRERVRQIEARAIEKIKNYISDTLV